MWTERRAGLFWDGSCGLHMRRTASSSRSMLFQPRHLLRPHPNQGVCGRYFSTRIILLLRQDKGRDQSLRRGPSSYVYTQTHLIMIAAAAGTVLLAHAGSVGAGLWNYVKYQLGDYGCRCRTNECTNWNTRRTRTDIRNINVQRTFIWWPSGPISWPTLAISATAHHHPDLHCCLKGWGAMVGALRRAYGLDTRVVHHTISMEDSALASGYWTSGSRGFL